MIENLQNQDVKTRFCPSPTGFIHLGNTRTALFNALLAKATNGNFLLRIEDTDKERSSQRYTDQLQEDLRWLGLVWDEGPGCDEGLGPYHQSNRQAIYDDYYHRLESTGLAYPCFCSQEELALTRKIQRRSGKPPRYPGTCANLSEQAVQEKLAQGLQPTLRFRVSTDEVVEFVDLVRGAQVFQSNDIGDFIIRRADGTSPFMFCNAIDDALMEVTHVLRGEDHLTNTPRQVMILQALGLRVPTYGHIALINGPDGTPLSKRHGSRSVKELREVGYLPLALINYLARLGHYYGNDRWMKFAELAEAFNIDSLSKSPAKFNPEQLLYWQKQGVNELDSEVFWQWVGEEIMLMVPQQSRELFFETIRPNINFPNEVAHWAYILFSDEWALEDTQRDALQSVPVDYFKVAKAAFANEQNDIKQVVNDIKTTLQLKGKALYQPLRLALTGEPHGPELGKLCLLLGQEKVMQRMQQML